MENVSNLISVNKGTIYNEILQKMDKLGYNISSGVLCAADYGAPQMRRRAIFIGTRKDLPCVHLPLPTHSSEKNMLDLLPFTTVGDAFNGLPSLE